MLPTSRPYPWPRLVTVTLCVVAALTFAAPPATAAAIRFYSSSSSGVVGRNLNPQLSTLASVTARTCQLRHTVGRSETCTSIAADFNITLEELKENNDNTLDCATLRVGDLICIQKVADSSSSSSSSSTSTTSYNGTSGYNVCTNTYSTQSGDTCSSLIAEFTSNLPSNSSYITISEQFTLVNPSVNCFTTIPVGTSVCLNYTFNPSDSGVRVSVTIPTPVSGCTATTNITNATTCDDLVTIAQNNLANDGYNSTVFSLLTLYMINNDLNCGILPNVDLVGYPICVDRPITVPHETNSSYHHHSTSTSTTSDVVSSITSTDDSSTATETSSATTSTHSVSYSSDSFAGINSYFLHTLSDSDQNTVLDAIANANYRVIRIFIVHVYEGNKGTSATGVNDIEENAIGSYDDTVLGMIDNFMLKCYNRGLKLIIALHDRYSLGTWDSDAYANTYGASAFYTDSNAQAAFDKRINHILTHTNPNFNNRPWSDLEEVVFAFEPENEAMGHMDFVNSNWHCDRAATIRGLLPSGSGILISTGGGTDFYSSLYSAFFSCSNIDIVSVHSYGNDASYKLSGAVSSANAAGKRVMYEEFGNTGYSKASGNAAQADAANSLGVPWLAWEASMPSIYDDFEFWTDEDSWSSLAGYAATA
ncbi:hypothetical protein HK405_003272, partial [Cladochytrium tenue]